MDNLDCIIKTSVPFSMVYGCRRILDALNKVNSHRTTFSHNGIPYTFERGTLLICGTRTDRESGVVEVEFSWNPAGHQPKPVGQPRINIYKFHDFRKFLAPLTAQ